MLLKNSGDHALSDLWACTVASQQPVLMSPLLTVYGFFYPSWARSAKAPVKHAVNRTNNYESVKIDLKPLCVPRTIMMAGTR
jgi:hypothetical protein